MKFSSTWFGYTFSVLALIPLVVGAVRGSKWWFWCGLVVVAEAIAFLLFETTARALQLGFVKQYDREREVTEALGLAESLADDDMRRRLYIALSLHLAGAQQANMAMPQVLSAARGNSTPTRTLPPVVTKQRRRRGRRGGRRRGGRKEQGLVRLSCC